MLSSVGTSTGGEMRIEFFLSSNFDYWLKLFPEENTLYRYSLEYCFRVGRKLTIMAVGK